MDGVLGRHSGRGSDICYEQSMCSYTCIRTNVIAHNRGINVLFLKTTPPGQFKRRFPESERPYAQCSVCRAMAYSNLSMVSTKHSTFWVSIAPLESPSLLSVPWSLEPSIERCFLLRNAVNSECLITPVTPYIFKTMIVQSTLTASELENVWTCVY